MFAKDHGKLAIALGLMFGYSPVMAAEPVGTAFNYQGRMTQQNQLVDEPADLQFTLWDAEVDGNQIGAMIAMNDWPIEDGLFSVELDFGPFAFLGEGRYLEIAVRTPAGEGAFVTLAPRQRLNPTPYAIGLSLPFQAEYADPGNLFSIANLGGGRALNVQISNPANGEAALNALTNGSGPAAYFLNDGSGDAINARVAMGTGTGVYGESGGVGVHGVHTSRGDATPGVIGETASSGAGAMGVLGRVTTNTAGSFSAGVRGINAGTRNLGIGVYGSHEGEGWGVYGRSPGGRGVYGQSDSGAGVYGLHQAQGGTSPGVRGVTQSLEPQAAGVSGLASSTGTTQTHGVYGESRSVLGVGVYGVGADGVRGLGNQYGVYGEGTDSSSIGVFAVGYGGRTSQPALRADNFDGPAIEAYGAWAIRGEGDEAGVVGSTWDADGVGGAFTNFEGGIALRTSGDVEINGDMEVNGEAAVEVLHITGADLAERFPFSEDAQPGMVVAIDAANPGRLCLSRSAYNSRVAGVISGANDLDAGVILGNLPGSDGHLPVALTGRVWVHTDATHAPVEPGTMMTTADIPGYAMPVIDRDRASGAIIGKAMTTLPKGEKGMVLVFVNLQ